MRLRALVRRATVDWVPFSPVFDRFYALARFVRIHRRWPRKYLFNDRLFRLKWEGELLDPLRQVLTDKVHAKEFVKARLGEQCVIKTLAVLRSEKDINGYRFPEKCVVKAAHSCGNTLFCRDGTVDREQLASWLKSSYYRRSREQNHAFLRPKIIVEEFAFGSDVVPEDYKLFCVDGQPRAIMAVYDRFVDQTRVFYDTEWNPQPYSILHPIGRPRPRPANLDDMLAAAATLSQGFSFIRVDLYSDGDSFKVGEITNCHGSAIERFLPAEGELLLSTLLFGEEA